MSQFIAWVIVALLLVAVAAMAIIINRNNTANSIAAAQNGSLEERRRELIQREERISEREDRLTESGQLLREESLRINEEYGRVRTQREELEEANHEISRIKTAAEAELARIGGLSHEEAVAEVMEEARSRAKVSATLKAKQLEADIIGSAQQRAAEVLATTIQRVAAEQTAEAVITSVDLPREELKGRIIGREGRNIRVFEQVTGVNVIIDDTPGVVLLSCFDPVRREAARLTLTELIGDGRINPARIEEMHARSQARVAEECRRAGVEALEDLDINDVAEPLLPVIGSLQYRTSYGQNVLSHLRECARLAGAMAAELGLDAQSCKRAAFMHDIGKALVTAGDGSHALEGAELAAKHGEPPEVVNSIASHHGEVEANCVEAVITQAADTISSSRPGARRESLEAYVKRLESIEEIGLAHSGVDRVYAMQSGREVRVVVLPDQVSDDETQILAADIAAEIQDKLAYPGNVKVTVVRESRATAMAH